MFRKGGVFLYKRAIGIFCVLAFLFGGMGWRVWNLSNTASRSVIVSQSTRKQVVATARATIYDRYGQPLVNSNTYSMAVLSASVSSLQAVYRSFPKSYRQEIVNRLMSGERVMIDSKQLDTPQSITTVDVPARYDDNALAVHTIGYIDEEGNGVAGIEKGYDTLLKENGGEISISYTVDAMGRAGIDSNDDVQSSMDRTDNGIMLTLDKGIQSLTQNIATAHMQRGAVLVSDAATAELLACVSLPLYDPKDVAAVLDRMDSPLLDRTLLNYNVGSVFKIITAAAALESGITEDTVFHCDGAVEIGNVKIRCHNKNGDGTQTMREAMANSCNSYFIQLALLIGTEPIREMAVRAGFGEKLYCANGVATAESVISSWENLSSDVALANLAIGQGDLLASPVHIQALIGAVVNNGIWYSPSLYIGRVEEGEIYDESTQGVGTRLFSAQTARQIRAMLEAVVSEGTGVSASPVAMCAAGKTGTAETGWIMNGEEVVQSWFSGFYPSDNPQYVITVLSENGGSNGKIAAPIFAAICDGLYEGGLVEKREVCY